MARDTIELWLWRYTDEFGKRRVSRWRMTEEDAARYKGAVKVEGSLEIRKRTNQSTSDFLRSLPTSAPRSTTNAPGNSSGSDTSKD